MKKLVIFNVGGALSCYGEFDGKSVIVDLGKGNGFSPVEDFLLPLTERKDYPKFENWNDRRNGKYKIDQLFISHLDNDHISDFPKFQEEFASDFMTCPSTNERQNDEFILNGDKIDVENETKKLILDEMDSRTPVDDKYPNMSEENPLISIIDELSLFYIKPVDVEKAEELNVNYANNISLVLFGKVGEKTVLLPGDLMKNGMEYLIDNYPFFKSCLEEYGVDYLVAPHHGLQSAFSSDLFNTMKDNKTRLNIISEKVRVENSEENRGDVDGRYWGTQYSTGENSLGQYGAKTSGGHIIIDFETDETDILRFQDIDDVINEFL